MEFLANAGFGGTVGHSDAVPADSALGFDADPVVLRASNALLVLGTGSIVPAGFPAYLRMLRPHIARTEVKT